PLRVVAQYRVSCNTYCEPVAHSRYAGFRKDRLAAAAAAANGVRWPARRAPSSGAGATAPNPLWSQEREATAGNPPCPGVAPHRGHSYVGKLGPAIRPGHG